MKFIDEVKITVQAGKGGNGCVSFSREKFKPRGGPDGGDGGKGGDVYLQTSQHLNTLADFQYQKRYQAENGKPGQGSNKTGAQGKDLTLTVPVGTVIYDEYQQCITELTEPNKRYRVAHGGRPGVGNTRFKSSTNRSPRQYTLGEPGDTKTLCLELKLLADVGLLGLPNAGKSTFLNAVSSAKPRVAGYPFTTEYPILGVVAVNDQPSFVVADIPGLLQGASQGVGLGTQFLRHLHRTQVLLHLVDIAYSDEYDPIEAIQVIQHEIAQHSEQLINKEQWLVLNKADLLTETECQAWQQQIIDQLNWQQPIWRISAATGHNVQALCQAIGQRLQSTPNAP